MTKRQKKLGLTDYEIKRGVEDNEFLLHHRYFLAKISTVKKGDYHGMDLVVMWFGMKSSVKHEEIKPFLFGLTSLMPDNFLYTDTHGLDKLTIR